MASGEKLCEALKAIIENLDENINHHQDIEAIEAENKSLCAKKTELIVNLKRPFKVDRSIVLIKDMQLRQKILNEFRFESKLGSLEKFKSRSCDARSETCTLKEKLKDSENCMTLSYHEVLNKIFELRDKTNEHRSVIDELTTEESRLVQNEQRDAEEAEDIRFIETLKNLVEEQRQLIEKLKRGTI